MWTASKIKVYLHALWDRLVRRDPAKISASYAGTDECPKPRMDAESTGATNAACGLRYAACRTCHSDLNLMFSFQRKLLGTGTVLPIQSCRSVEWLVSEGEVSGESRGVIILTDRSDGLDALTPKHQLITTGIDRCAESRTHSAQGCMLSAQPVPRGSSRQSAPGTAGPTQAALPRATGQTLGTAVPRAHLALITGPSATDGVRKLTAQKSSLPRACGRLSAQEWCQGAAGGGGPHLFAESLLAGSRHRADKRARVWLLCRELGPQALGTEPIWAASRPICAES
jgi:hypothetical protein